MDAPQHRRPSAAPQGTAVRRCGLVSPGSAERCECGRSFATREAPRAVAGRDHARRWGNVLGAGFFAVVGAAVGVASLVHVRPPRGAAAATGGTPRPATRDASHAAGTK